MPKLQFQPQLVEYQSQILEIQDANIEYRPHFIEPDKAWVLLKTLMSETDWQQERIRLYGKTHNVPRLSCWMAARDLHYSYSNMAMQPVAWSETVLELKNYLQQQTGESFNSVLLNYYRDGKDSNGWHSDDEPELGSNPVIASISLGGARDFHLRHKRNKQYRQSLKLGHGSLLIMKGRTQHCWQHHLPKRAKADARINLTFRTVYPT